MPQMNKGGKIHFWKVTDTRGFNDTSSTAGTL